MKRIPLPQTVMHEDLLESIEMERKITANSTADPFFNTYRTIPEYNAFLNNLESLGKSKGITISRFTVGTTGGNNPIYGIKFSGTSAAKKKIVLNGAQHAREWISCTTVAYIAWYLLENYNNQNMPDVKATVDGFEWHFIPVTNPDGYIWSYGNSNNRMWRKNRQTNSGSTCLGVDTNRNWNYYWNNGGTSNNPCQDTYLGASAFSTREASLLGAYLNQWKNHRSECILYYNDVHSYSQLYMNPWGWSNNKPRDDASQRAVLEVGINAIRNTMPDRKSYQWGNVFSTIYQASGAAVDYGYGDRGGGPSGGAGILYSYTYELRDTGTYGFTLPTNQIDAQGIEICNAMVATAKYLLNVNCP